MLGTNSANGSMGLSRASYPRGLADFPEKRLEGSSSSEAALACLRCQRCRSAYTRRRLFATSKRGFRWLLIQGPDSSWRPFWPSVRRERPGVTISDQFSVACGDSLSIQVYVTIL